MSGASKPAANDGGPLIQLVVKIRRVPSWTVRVLATSERGREELGDRAANFVTACGLYGLHDGLFNGAMDLSRTPPRERAAYELGRAMGCELRRRAFGETSDDHL